MSILSVNGAGGETEQDGSARQAARSRRDRLTIRPFVAGDQAAAQALILAGLGERWGWIDPTLNPDLHDIAASYASGLFLVAHEDGELIATGAFMPEAPGVVRIVRMSVRRDLRRQGIGRTMLQALLDRARGQAMRQVVLETTSTWHDAVAFYLRNGFQIVDVRDGETHMLLDLMPPEQIESETQRRDPTGHAG